MNSLEQQIRTRLGIPTTATYVLIIDQAAHMDWDWDCSFIQYFSREGSKDRCTYDSAGVDQLLSHAVELLLSNPTNTTPGAGPPMFYYSLCEMGFFQQFVRSQADRGIDILSKIRAASNYLRIVGGGITSPDCLLTSGEGFLRNYLLGKLWLANLFPELLPLNHCWLPDDFGQDPELPVAVKALGMTSISFSRLPGIPPSAGIHNTELETEMLTTGADFLWAASDKASTVYTHWMTGPVPGYFQGAGLAKSCGAQQDVVTSIQIFLGYNNLGLTQWTPPYSAAPTNYLYMALDDDFMYPITGLLDIVKTWNSSGQGQNGGVYAVEASYDDFVSLVLNSGVNLATKPYNGTPYWTGFYMSRPGLKILHYGATRSLLAAEVFGLLASGNVASTQNGVLLDPLYWDRLSRAWNDFAPSTHHDYITGTSPDWVAQLEQLPLLQTAYDEASRSAEQALDALAASVGANAGDVVIANPSGVQFNGLVELPAPGLGGMKSIEIGETSTSVPVQATFEGGSVFAAGVQSTGYITGTPSSQEANATSTATISPESPGADSYTLQNEFMTVVVDAASHWGISSLVDASGNPLLAANGIGNDLVFYADTGNLYQFGNEIPEATFSPAGLTVETVGDGLGPVILETGPLRVRLKTVVSIAIEGTNLPAQLYTREYCLVAGEPFLRMTTTGAAPNVGDWAQTGYSVMTAFPLASKVDSLTHGTPCHWTTTQPYDYWAPPVFQPTHHFVLPMAGGELLAAIYHHEVVAWGYDGNGVLLGCLLRNTPAGGRGASGSDPDTHTLRYALRVSSGLGDPSTGQPLSEALSYVAPAMARIAPGVAVDVPDTLPGNGFIASVSPPGVIQAAKPGDVTPGTLILRIYQPSNSSQKLTVTLGRGQPAAVVAVTALEDPITSDAPAIETSDTGFTIQATTALSTVQVSFPEW